ALAQVLRDDVRGEIARGLSIRQPSEAAVDDRDLDSLPREALVVPGSGERDADFLPAHGGLDAGVGRADAIDAGALGETRQRRAGDHGLHEPVRVALDASAGGEDAAASESRVPGLDDDADAIDAGGTRPNCLDAERACAGLVGAERSGPDVLRRLGPRGWHG